MSIYRQQALANRWQRRKEHEHYRPNAHFVLFGVALLVITIAAVYVLTTTTYRKKETVPGHIVILPEPANIRTGRAGVIAKLHVAEGDTVEAGQPLLTLANPEETNSIANSKLERIASSQRSLENIEQQIIAEQRRYDAQISTSERQLALADSELSLNGRQQLNLRERITLTRSTLERYLALVEHDYVSGIDVTRQRDTLLQMEGQLMSLSEHAVSLQRKRIEQETLTPQLQLQREEVIARLKLQRETLQQAHIALLAAHDLEIRAPIQGTVSGITVALGQHVTQSQALLHIVPQSSTYRAVLSVPTNAIGFMAVGNEVSLRVSALPYQTFGSLPARIETISQAPLDTAVANDGKPQRHYLVRARLSSNHLSGYGRNFMLRDGMDLQADIITERRTLLRWLFDPIYSLQGRMGGNKDRKWDSDASEA